MIHKVSTDNWFYYDVDVPLFNGRKALNCDLGFVGIASQGVKMFVFGGASRFSAISIHYC